MKEWKNQKTHFCSFLTQTHRQTHSECILLLTDTVPVMFSVLLYSIFNIQILYSLQLNCTYRNYTKTAAANVQLHKWRERVQLLSSEVQCGRLFDTVCVYKQSYPEIRPFKEIRMIKNALPHHHNATQTSPKLQSGDCKAAFAPTRPL